MREEGPEAPREEFAPQAYAFDGWSMVPIEAAAARPPRVKNETAEPELPPVAA